jgi:4-hydroxymandelate oxidase
MGKEVTRRNALLGLGLWMAASPLLEAADESPGPIAEPERLAPLDELVNTLEAEPMAKRMLPAPLFAKIAGSNRKAFDRMTLHPHVARPTRDMDLTVDLFGTQLFAPILAGPASRMARFHAEGELALARGAAAARTAVIISGSSSHPLDKVAAEAKSGAWCQVYPQADMTPVLARVQQAAQAGCRAVCITVGTPYMPTAFDGAPNPAQMTVFAKPDMTWAVVDQVRQAGKLPVVLKGIMSPEEARAAVERGVDGIIVSNHGGRFVEGLITPIEVLPEIVDAVGGKIPVLMDSDIRRGSDIVKALALGARAVLLGRGYSYGLAAGGEAGATRAVDIFRADLLRTLKLLGCASASELSRDHVAVPPAWAVP